MQYSMFFFVQTHILKSSLFYTLGFAMYSVQNITFTGSIISNIYIEMPISDFNLNVLYTRDSTNQTLSCSQSENDKQIMRIFQNETTIG